MAKFPNQPPEPTPVEKKKPAAAPERKAKVRRDSPWPWGPAVRTLVSVLVIAHLLAVFSAPWAIQLGEIFVPALPPGFIPRDQYGRDIAPKDLSPEKYPPLEAQIPKRLGNFFWYYTNLLYINNGYDFFSPDPGVSHIIRYEIFNDAGERIAKGQFPDRHEQWPRLFYHRHMMLADQSSDTKLEGAGWENRIADRLLEVHGGSRVHMEEVIHHLLTPAQVLAGEKIDADKTYEVLGVMDHRRGDQATPNEPGVRIPGGRP